MLNMESRNEFIEAVQTMRQLQKDYFATRDTLVLQRARMAEGRVDKMLDEMLNPGLFD